jgi:hypothetical protein
LRLVVDLEFHRKLATATAELRRHMPKGQRAMVAAKVRLLFNRSIPVSAKTAGVSQQYVGFASIVLQYRPDLADANSRE